MCTRLPNSLPLTHSSTIADTHVDVAIHPANPSCNTQHAHGCTAIDSTRFSASPPASCLFLPHFVSAHPFLGVPACRECSFNSSQNSTRLVRACKNSLNWGAACIAAVTTSNRWLAKNWLRIDRACIRARVYAHTTALCGISLPTLANPNEPGVGRAMAQQRCKVC